ncbi:LapA family protein [Chlorobaculum thiosulfatiphilum]|uniref:LapA family protein n=1 Tax=Chlorobaculum thiosulfatiphilum TaxID=115852 RepID=A0A5C4RY69_CHLTI|nr:LapA family protein [Chlorobaculum thiosulfatiphilum]TNJ36060.1 LapA family protein [Chlorobaculum thiosulfatiphilum]
MATLYLIIALLIAVLAVVFALQNSMLVTVSFFSWTITGSLSLVLLATLAIGVLIGLLVLSPALLKKTFKSSSQRKRIDALENEVSQHKAKVAELQKPVPALSPPETQKLPQSLKKEGDGNDK